ncbi:hypothetical protein KUTeg_019739 [Tegillarca granosa]|uniref:Integrase core domain-containing protein n=1 Tax=Tegillarca granosa TaxID=220873 RepID=A0ABQ9EJE7_TEGGR|nr:hypothetical protein KUTeg_019739 [Tegillarca granosa]
MSRRPNKISGFDAFGLEVLIISIFRFNEYLGCPKSEHLANIIEVAHFLKRLLRESSRLYGYKFMHLKSIQHGFVVNQETVRLLMHFLDPVGIEHRRRGRLQRRVYNNPGPDFMWHMDSYDKLKPYGFCINGAITSSDPAVIGSYFLKAVASKLGCPVRVRADRGTENGHVEAMQTFLRMGHGNTFSSVPFMYGSSNHNQRIEAWWCFLRRHMAQFWMNIFHIFQI